MTDFLMSMGNFQGEFYALGAALLWALSSILFKTLGKTIRPLELNLIKGISGFVLFAITSLVIGEIFTSIRPAAVFALAISGAVGIGFGDTMFFEAINRLGARRSLLITILAPPMTVIFAWIFLRESLSMAAWIGILITILGVAWVITEKNKNEQEENKFTWLGVFFGFLAALTQAGGAVLSRWALTESSVSALQSALIRLLAGTVVLLLWILIRREKIGGWLKPAPKKQLWGILTAVILFGTYIAIWMQQLAFKFTNVGIAQTLLATSPLFILPLSALQKERLSLRSVLGVLVSIAGVALIFLAG
ncbi:MAG TPA: EamA family transporter [Anaerolineaceae bacterium]|nr:EamA family transporter [Anaerolineaceae bacterium]